MISKVENVLFVISNDPVALHLYLQLTFRLIFQSLMFCVFCLVFILIYHVILWECDIMIPLQEINTRST